MHSFDKTMCSVSIFWSFEIINLIRLSHSFLIFALFSVKHMVVMGTMVKLSISMYGSNETAYSRKVLCRE